MVKGSNFNFGERKQLDVFVKRYADIGFAVDLFCREPMNSKTMVPSGCFDIEMSKEQIKAEIRVRKESRGWLFSKPIYSLYVLDHSHREQGSLAPGSRMSFGGTEVVSVTSRTFLTLMTALVEGIDKVVMRAR